MIFVFGSNTAGIHGAGAAAYAHKYEGAKWGVGVGITGNSYAIPTKDKNLRTLPLPTVRAFINNFIEYATDLPQQNFKVTRIGCGLAGYTNEDIAPMFLTAPKNCFFDAAWRPILGNDFEYWGALP